MNDRTVTTPADLGARSCLLADKHAAYIKRVAEDNSSLEYHLTEHFRLSGIYWGMTALYLVDKLDIVDGEAIVQWVGLAYSASAPGMLHLHPKVLQCQNRSAGFGGSPRHDPHILYTLSAVQILALYNKTDMLDADAVAAYIANLQQPDGSFTGDEWGEVDTRFSYVALNCCSLLDRLEVLNVPKAVDFLVRCKNFDGSFGHVPGAESHSGHSFTSVAALAIADGLEHMDTELLCWWLAERQTASGGLNGRPEKLQDVCYSWWCLSALSILGRLHWIDQQELTRFILFCQDEEDGGISDRPEDAVDAFHTFFGIAALSLMGYKGLKSIDPVYALPVEVMQRLRARQKPKAPA